MTKSQEKHEQQPVSIWTWVGIVLGVYGFIVSSMGVYYAVEPETLTATGQYNPSLWWGLVMLVAGVAFLLIGRREQPSKPSHDR